MTMVLVTVLIEVDDDKIGDEDPCEVAKRCMLCIPQTVDRGVVHPVSKHAREISDHGF